MTSHSPAVPPVPEKSGFKLNKNYVPRRLPEGVVVGVWGDAVRIEGGERQALHVGDVIKKGVVILTEQDGIVMIEPKHPVRVTQVTVTRAPEVKPPAPEVAHIKAADLPHSVTVTEDPLYVARIEEAVVPIAYSFQGAAQAVPPDVLPARMPSQKAVIGIGGRDVVESDSYALFSISLSAGHVSPIQIRLDLLQGSAKIPGDFLPQMEFSADGHAWSAVSDGLIELQQGVVAAYVRTPIVNDQLHENTEQFELTAQLVGGQAVLAQSASQITTNIVDDDASPMLKISAIQPVLNEQAGIATFEVTLSAPSALPVSVQYTTADGTAVGGLDYSHVAGVITFAPGETSKTITVPVLNDSVFEGSETFRVELYNPVDASIEVPSAMVTVVDDGTGYGGSDDDTPRVVAVTGATAVEGQPLDFHVGLSHSATTPVDVLLGVQGGTAALDVDTARVLVSFDGGQSFSVVTAPVVSVPVGVTSFDVRVETVGDVIHESNEALTVSAQVVGQAAPVVAEGAIVDNDPLPVLSIVTPDLVVNEAAGVITYRLALDGQSDAPVSARVQTVAGTATAGVDFEVLDTVVTFAPGQTEAFVSVRILNDSVYEGAEAFQISLSQPAGLVLGKSVETTVIRDDGLGAGGSDNDLPSMTITGGLFSEGAGHAVFSLHLSNPSVVATTYDLALSGLTASPGGDFGRDCQVSLDGGASWVAGSSVTFAPGAVSALVRVAIVDDSLNEFSEDFALTATPSAGPVRSETVIGIATILDNDATPVLSIGGAVVNEQAGLVELTVTLSAASGKQVSVDYSTADGTATQWADYIPMFGTLVFRPGETAQTIYIPIEDDNFYEVSEQLSIQLDAPVNAVIGVGTGVVEIRDDGTGQGGLDNDIPGMIIGDVTVNEGAAFASFTVSLMSLAAVPVSVSYATQDNTALVGQDYSSASGVITFAPGQSSVTIQVPILQDSVFERSENFHVVLSAPVNGVIISGTGIGTILDDGAGQGGFDNDMPTIVVADRIVNEAAGTVAISVSLSNPAAMPVTVHYATADGTARAGSDYSAVAGTLTFAAGQTTATVNVPITNDSVFERSEAFTLNLSAPVNASIADGVGVVTIKDDGTGAGGTDDDTPAISINDLNVNEAIGTATFTVSMTHPADMPVTVSFATRAGTAADGLDYVGQTGTITFAPGEVSKTLGVHINQDTALELAETFFVDLTAPTNATIAQAVGQCVINDNGTGAGGTDDDTPAFSINSVIVNEGAGTATFTVSLNRAAGVPVGVNYATADGTALAGADYTATSGTLTFAPGQTSQTITVSIANDGTFEGAENFSVNLSAASNATIAVASGLGTIVDDGTGTGGTDDDRPQLTIGDIMVPESAGFAVFTANLSHPSTAPVEIALGLADVTAVGGGVDYGSTGGTNLQVSTDGGITWVSSTTATFAPGATSVLVRTPVINDALDEVDESMRLTANVTAGTTTNTTAAGVATIVDATAAPDITINDVVVNEAAGFVTATISMSAASAQTVMVTYISQDGTATAVADYTPDAGTLTFAPGETVKTVSFAIANDATFEGPEQFAVRLQGAINANILDGLGVMEIRDDGTGPGGVDNDTPLVSVSNTMVNEGSGPAVFAVSMSHPSTTPVDIALSLVDGTALLGQDYASGMQISTDGGGTWVSGSSFTMAPGQVAALVRVPVTNDALDEWDEQFSLKATVTSGVTLNATAAGTGLILDDDAQPSLTIDSVTVNEAAGTATFTVSLDAPSGKTVAVDYASMDAAAMAGADYTATSGTLSFAPGVVSQTITVAITDDAVYEGAESFLIGLSAASNATIAVASGLGTIMDDGTGLGGADDDRPSVKITGASVNEAIGMVLLTVQLDKPAAVPVTVHYASADGTALAGSDYTAVTGTLTFAAGVTTQTIAVPIVNDAVYEGAESFVVNLSGQTNSKLAPVDAVGSVTIHDDGTGTGGTNSDIPTVSIDSPSVLENAGFAVFTVSLSNASTTPVSVSFASADGTAVLVTDYTSTLQVSTDNGVTWANSMTATFAPGATSVLVRAPVINDLLDEVDETFSVTATVTAGTTTNTAVTGVATILDNDPAPSISIDSVTVNEGAGTATFTVTLSAPSGKTVAVDYASMDAAAQAGADYTAVSGTLTFAAGVVSQTITVAITNDALYEGSEGFLIGLSGASNATIAVASGLGTIMDDGTGTGGTNDDRPSVKILGATVNEAIGTVFLTVQLDKPAAVPVAVNYASADGTALAGADYTAVSGTVTFAAGVTVQTIAVPIANDTVFEGSESFVVNLSGQTNSMLAPADAAGTVVINDDGTGTGGTNSDIPTISIDSPNVLENAGFAVFTASLSNASTTPVSVSFASAAVTATLGLDYTSALQVSTDNGVTWTPSAAATFAPGATAVLVRAPIIDDLLDEGSETFSVTATVASGTTTNTVVTGVATILDNDPTPSVSIDSVTVNEGTGSATLTLTLSAVSGLPVTVDYALAPGSATAPQDYIISAGTITFAPGVATRTIVVPIVNDTTYEGAESFSATLSNPTNATIFGAGIGAVTIMDDGTGTGGTNNDTPTVSVNSVSVNEDAGFAVFTVGMSNPSKFSTSLSLALAAGTATSGTDYTPALEFSTDGGSTWVLGSSLTIPAGLTSALVRTPIVADLLDEINEDFSLTATVTGGVTTNVSATGVATIVDTTPPPSVVINDITVNEGIVTATFTVTLSAPSAKTVSVDYASTNGSAAAGTDYTAVAGTLTFAPGVTSQTVSVVIANDAVYEGAESFQINLSAPTNVTVADAQGTGAIMDDGTGAGGTDNDKPSIVINDVVVNEAAGTATFTVTMSNAAAMPVTVDYATANGGATAGADYTATSGTLTFAAGVISQSVTVGIINDTNYEGAESFFVNLANPSNATISDVQGLGTIMDDGTGSGGVDNDKPALTVSSAAVLETAGFAVFTVSLSNPSQTPVALSLALAGVTATGGGVDYGSAGATNLQVSTDGGVTWANSTTATIAAGATSVLVRTPVIADALDENNETFSLTVTNLGATTTNSSVVANGAIIDTNAAPTISISSLSVNEAIGTADLTVTLSAVSGKTVTVSYATAGVTATAGADFTSASGLLTFAPGETTKTVSVPIINDAAFEGPETLNVTLSGASNASIATANGQITINDDGTGLGGTNDDRGTVSVVGSTVDEASGVVTFTLSLSSAQGLPVSVGYATADGTALAGSDYTAASGTATFAVGQTTATISVALVDDKAAEPAEMFQLNLNSPVNITLGTSTATGTITDTDAAPIAVNDSVSGLNNVPLAGSVLTNDSDPNGDPISVTGFVVGGVPYLPGASATIAGQGVFVLNADGSYVFTPVSTYVGNVAQVTYTVSDGGNAATSTLDIAMTPGNAAPVVTQALVYISEEGANYGHPDSAGLPVDMTNFRIITGTLNVADPEGGAVTIDLAPLSSDFAPVFYGVSAVAEWISYDPTIFDPLSTAGTNSQRVQLFYDASYGAGIATSAPSKAIMLQYDGVPYISLTIDNSGNYQAILMMDKSLKHPISGIEDLLAIGVGVVVSDGVNTATVQNAIQLNVEDDAPVFVASNSIQVIQQGTTVYGDLPELGLYGRLTVLGADNYLQRPISSVQVDGVTYSFSWDLESASASGPASWSYSAGSLTVNTVSGGVLQILASDGSYSYKAPSGISSDFSENLTYVVIDSDGDTASRSYSIAVSAASAMNVMSGTSADDNLTGTGGQDAIYGYAGWDTLSGGLGGDFIYGGTGKDSLYGGGGSDVFVWGSGEYANAEGVNYFSMKNRDFVRDFDVAPVAGGGDVIDLRGILFGESIALGNVDNYLHIDTTSDPGRSLVSVSSQGRYSGGYVDTLTSQAIDLIGGSLDVSLGLASGATSAQIVAAMIAQGKLLVDN